MLVIPRLPSILDRPYEQGTGFRGLPTPSAAQRHRQKQTLHTSLIPQLKLKNGVNLFWIVPVPGFLGEQREDMSREHSWTVRRHGGLPIPNPGVCMAIPIQTQMCTHGTKARRIGLHVPGRPGRPGWP